MKNSKRTVTCIISNIVICMIIGILALSGSGNTITAIQDNYKPYYNGNGAGVSIMINVYEGTEYIEPILKVLEQYNACATFFVGGIWVEKNVSTLQLIANSSNELGNHGYLHKDHAELSYKQNHQEIVITSRLIYEITGINIILFAPPSGSFSNNMLKVCEDLNYKVIMWSKDTIDWRDSDTNLIKTRACRNIQMGDFVLMHPTEHTLEALPLILEYYRDNNIPTVTVSHNLEGNEVL